MTGLHPSGLTDQGKICLHELVVGWIEGKVTCQQQAIEKIDEISKQRPDLELYADIAKRNIMSKNPREPLDLSF